MNKEGEPISTKKKKRKEKEVVEDDNEQSDIIESEAIMEKGEKKKKKKSSCDHHIATENRESNMETDIIVIEEDPAGTEVKKKKKKKKKSSCDISALDAGDQVIATKNRVSNMEMDIIVIEDDPAGTEVKKKKKKKKKNELQSKQGINSEEDVLPDCEGGEKKKNGEALTTVETPTPKKKQKISEESTPAKTVKKEESVEEHQEVTEVVFLSEKPGNQDEILINQERRLALQREIDEESQPKSTFGQWSTATFDSSDQQQKFLRLMGGFKKGNQPAASGVGRPNMALGKEEQQSLQQKLLGQFERAQNRRMDFTSKGAGLGFTAPSNKKFSIDVNASRSVKFDD
ncbi:hypothetical protein AALO_G00105790 [Alosa alosa]|uniref:Small acidic protein-like domain-containing protein n=1 Tax=Alosa alosa TaxID=278164 RepID=A0AAV6GVC8_9TELE|nr:hypothetical protein AALO_G00105790 [Alosa alosa]